jgi:peptidyl-prolyl cis-trans isomerase C
MRLKQHSLGIAAILAVAFGGVAACGNQATVDTASAAIESEIAARVNGDPIFASDIELEAVAQGLIDPGTEFGPRNPEYFQILEQLIDQRLLAQEALRRALDQDPAAQRRLAAGRERLLGNILVESLVANEVTEDAIDRMYDEQVKLQQLDDEVRLRQILVESAERATEIVTEIGEGREFADAALEYSEDVRTRLEGGDLGWINPNDLDDPYPAMIGDTVTGTLSEPFETVDGWVILKVDERRTTPPKTKQEMRPEIITFLTFTQISDILSELRIQADIEQRDPAEVLEDALSANATEPEETPSE